MSLTDIRINPGHLPTAAHAAAILHRVAQNLRTFKPASHVCLWIQYGDAIGEAWFCCYPDVNAEVVATHAPPQQFELVAPLDGVISSIVRHTAPQPVH